MFSLTCHELLWFVFMYFFVAKNSKGKTVEEMAEEMAEDIVEERLEEVKEELEAFIESEIQVSERRVRRLRQICNMVKKIGRRS